MLITQRKIFFFSRLVTTALAAAHQRKVSAVTCRHALGPPASLAVIQRGRRRPPRSREPPRLPQREVSSPLATATPAGVLLAMLRADELAAARRHRFRHDIALAAISSRRSPTPPSARGQFRRGLFLECSKTYIDDTRALYDFGAGFDDTPATCAVEAHFGSSLHATARTRDLVDFTGLISSAAAARFQDLGRSPR